MSECIRESECERERTMRRKIADVCVRESACERERVRERAREREAVIIIGRRDFEQLQRSSEDKQKN